MGKFLGWDSRTVVLTCIWGVLVCVKKIQNGDVGVGIMHLLLVPLYKGICFLLSSAYKETEVRKGRDVITIDLMCAVLLNPISTRNFILWNVIFLVSFGQVFLFCCSFLNVFFLLETKKLSYYSLLNLGRYLCVVNISFYLIGPCPAYYILCV